MARLTTPYQLLPVGTGRSLFARIDFRSGFTLLKENGAWSARVFPNSAALEAAELYYLGGHEQEVSLVIGREIVAAGLATEVLTDPIVEPVTDEIGEVLFEGVEI